MPSITLKIQIRASTTATTTKTTITTTIITTITILAKSYLRSNRQTVARIVLIPLFIRVEAKENRVVVIQLTDLTIETVFQRGDRLP